MGIAYRSDVTTGLTVAVVHGAVTRDEFHEFAKGQGEDPSWHATTRSLTDARTAVTPPVTAAELGAFAEMYAQMRRGDQPFKAAIVGGHDFELAGRYGELRSDDGSTTIAFNDLSTACIWLGVDLAAVQATIDELRAPLGDSESSPSASAR